MAKKLNLSTCTDAEREQYWADYANEQLQGLTIKQCRYLTQEEADSLGWGSRCVVLELSNGTLIFPSQDDEGNGAGSLFGNNTRGKSLTFPVLY